jgi:hypothetical protein
MAKRKDLENKTAQEKSFVVLRDLPPFRLGWGNSSARAYGMISVCRGEGIRKKQEAIFTTPMSTDVGLGSTNS